MFRLLIDSSDNEFQGRIEIFYLSFSKNIRSFFFLVKHVQALWPTEHKCHLHCAIYYTVKKCGYIGCPKKRHSRPTSTKAEKHAKLPQSPHPKRSPGQPRPRDRDRSNRARHTKPSAALMHLPTSLTPQPKPAKAPPRTGVPRSNKSPPLRHRSNASIPLRGHPAHQSSP